MEEKINLLKAQAYEIITLCTEELKVKSPNINILKIIKKEFEEIIDCIEREGKIRVLNPRKQLLSSRLISDSADFNYNKELFLKITDFSNKCEKIPANYLKILYDY